MGDKPSTRLDQEKEPTLFPPMDPALGGNLADTRIEVRTVITCAIDDIALAALRDGGDAEERCSVCEEPIVGERGGTGLMMWTRGDDVRYDEPPLCSGCAASIAVHAWNRWQQPDGGD